MTWLQLSVLFRDRLSQMILDQVFFGVLNESVGTLEVYDEPVEDVRDIPRLSLYSN